MCCTVNPTLRHKFSVARDTLVDSHSGRGWGTWTGRKYTQTNTHTCMHRYTLTHCLSQITWTIRSFKRISQWEGAALESHAPDGYWSILSLHTDTHAKQAQLLLLVINNKFLTLLLHFSVLNVVRGSALQLSVPLNSGLQCNTSK